VLFPTCQLDTDYLSLPCAKRHVARLMLMCFLVLDGVTECQLLWNYGVDELTMMNVCIEWRIVTVHQPATTRLHKCHTRITPELYILNAALPHSVLVALTSSTAFTPSPVSILHISTSTSLYIHLYQPSSSDLQAKRTPILIGNNT
jgi:hypothetical protein